MEGRKGTGSVGIMKGRRVGNKEGIEEGWKEWVRLDRRELQKKAS